MPTTWEIRKEPLVEPCMEFRINDLARFFEQPSLEDAWWTMLIELEGISLEQLVKAVEDVHYGEYLRIPEVYDELARGETGRSQFFTIYAQKPLLEYLNAIEGEKDNREALQVVDFTLGSIIPNPYFNSGMGAPPPEEDVTIPVDKGTVVMAVIDNGIAFGNALFRTGDKSRVAFAWIMETGTGGLPGLGRKLDKTEIDGLLQSNMTAGLLDEDAFYRDVGLIDYAVPGFKPAALRVSHGTHVMGLCAGSQTGAPSQPHPIISVDLPTVVTRDPSGAELAPNLELAIEYVREKAKRFKIGLKKRAPLVVNFSYGNFAGPHDGTGLIDRMIDDKLKPTGNEIVSTVLPAGNGNLSRCHAEVGFADVDLEPRVLDLRVLPDDKSASYVELWMPFPTPKHKNFVNVRLTAPDGQVCDPVGTNGAQGQVLKKDGEVIARIDYRFVKHETKRGLITICIAPTASDVTTIGLAPAGIWKISVEKDELPPGESVQCWVRRDETLPGFPPFGRQSHFDNADYVRFNQYGLPLQTDPVGGAPGFDCMVKRAGALSGFACADVPSVIAGYVADSGDLSDYSSAGPITGKQGGPPNRLGPDATAIADDSDVLFGVFSAGSRSGSVVAMDGTSVAAPQVARWLGTPEGQADGANRTAVWNKGAAGEFRFPGVGFPQQRAGGGRMDLNFRIVPKRIP